MIYVTGDTHGTIDSYKLDEQPFASKEFTKEDYVIICGDFGFVWNYEGQDFHEKYWLDWLENKPYTVLFVDGNHECFPRLFEFEEKEWNGGRIHEIRPYVYHLMRGQVFTLQGKKFFTFGGASSHDRGPSVGNTEQVIGKYWWPEELPNQREKDEGLENLRKHNWKVDYVITHCLPTNYQAKFNPTYTFDHLTDYLMDIEEKTDYGHWYCGHYHKDEDIDDKVSVLYRKIRRIE